MFCSSKAHLVKEPVRPRYLKLLFHWVLQTKMTRNNLLKAEGMCLMTVMTVLIVFEKERERERERESDREREREIKRER